MADEESGTDGGGPADDIQCQFNEAVGKLSGPGEPLIALGAILFVFVDIFGDLLFDEWSVGNTQMVAAWFAIGAVVLYRFRNSALPVSYPLLLVTVGLIAGFLGVRQILQDLDNSLFDRDSASIIYALITWVASILMLLGAIQLWPSATKS